MKFKVFILSLFIVLTLLNKGVATASTCREISPKIYLNAHFEEIRKSLELPVSSFEDTLLKYIKENKNTLTREGIYRKLASLLGSTANIHKYLKNRYTNNNQGETLFKEVLLNLGHEYLVLLVDPGIVFHFDEFMKIALQLKKSNPNEFNKIGPWGLRQFVENEMGKITLYHAKILNIDVAKKLKDEGLPSPHIYHTINNSGNVTLSELKRAFTAPIQEQYIKRFYLQPNDNLLLSTTEIKHFGAFVALENTKNMPSDKKLYELKLSVSKLNTFWAEFSGKMIADSKNYQGDEGIIENEIEESNIAPKSYETFIPIMIDKSEIKEVKEIKEEEFESIANEVAPDFLKLFGL